MKKKQALLFTTLGLILLFFLTIYPFLSKTEVVNSELMIVEGWVDNYTLKIAANEFSVQENKFLVTTGGPVSGNDFLMTFNSELRFEIDSFKRLSAQEQSVIEVLAYGEDLEGVFPHFNLAVNDSVVGRGITIDELNRFVFEVGFKPEEIKTVSIIFDNDESNSEGDRNLAVRSITVNNQKYTPFVKGVALNYKMSGRVVSERVYRTYAEKSRNFLEKTGISHDKIISIPTPFVERDRTYESALQVKKILGEKYPDLTKINIVTEGPHARRSWMMYKKAFGDKYDIGVIGIDNPERASFNWWRSKKGIADVMIQFGKYLYAQFIFSPFY